MQGDASRDSASVTIISAELRLKLHPQGYITAKAKLADIVGSGPWKA